MKRELMLCFAVLALVPLPALAEPRWTRPDAQELLALAEQVQEEGLDPADYAVGALRAALAATNDTAWQGAARTTFVRLADDFAQGHLRNRRAVAWYLPGPVPADGPALMDRALSGAGVRATLTALLPQHRQYRELKAALATLPPRDKAGALRLRANLERWRWMPRDLGRRYLLVNVPAFTVSLVEDNKVVARRRVIVGKIATPTPQFAAQVTGVIFNPWWEIPPSIVRESVGRLVATDPAQAAAKGYVAAGGRYRQRPGPGNSLGQAKLVMPNPYNVYLHDTPNKALFDAEVRAFSHGCIRTQDIFGLAASLLAGADAWDRSRIDAAVAGGATTKGNLAEPLPIYVAYFTTAIEDGGELATFPDIYGRDTRIVAALTGRLRNIPDTARALAGVHSPGTFRRIAMKNVLLLVHDDPGQEARLQAALDLTRALSGHLTCVDVTPLPLMVDPVWGVSSGTIVYDETTREAANLDRVRERLGREDVAWNIEALRGDFSGCLGEALRSADVVVLNHALIGAPVPDMGMILGNLLDKHEVLAVAVPAEARRLTVTGPVMIAWDGSAVVMRTIRRAVPLLALADSVTIVQVGDLSTDALDAQEAATYLSRHGITSNVVSEPRSTSIAEQLCRSASLIQAGYCLMGAYGHSRLREAIFGGVTKEMLAPGGPPLILGH